MMQLPADVKQIIDTLYANGHEAYAVGGCVRDMLLGRTPEDWDITTSAMPEETKRLFERTFDTGIEHGTITVLLNGEGYEVTTYRIDGTYEDSRHPSEVAFTRNLQEDLQRRDFTINAMAYNDREGLVDIFGGQQDLKAGVIRCVGNAEERFGEDALRILRAIRFSAQLGFEIEEHTCRGIQKLASNLSKISAERIQVEMVKLLVSSNPDHIELAYVLGVTKVIFPEWDAMMETTQENKHHMYTVGGHTLEALRHTEGDKMIRIAMLLHDVAKPRVKTMEASEDDGIYARFIDHDVVGVELSKEILRRWKFDNETINVVGKLVLHHDLRMEPTPRNIRYAMHLIGAELFPKYLAVRYGDIMGQSTYNKEEKLEMLAKTRMLYEEVLEKRQCTTLKQLAITGNDLIYCGVQQGKEIGEVLQVLLELVIEYPEYNTKEYLVEKVYQMRRQ